MNPITATALLPASLLALLASPANAAPPPQGAHYIAICSSFAAGPGISPRQAPSTAPAPAPSPAATPFVPYHPNLAGMTAVATAIEALLNKPRDTR